MSTPSVWKQLRHVLGGYPTTAADWAVRTQCPDVTREELLVLDQWLTADPRNAQAYAEVNKIGYLGAQLREHSEELLHLEGYQRLLATRRQSRVAPEPRFGRFVTLAGSCALLLLAVTLSWFWYSNGRYSAGHGEQQRIALADGSSVVVNTDSEVKVRYDDHVRIVELPRGEAFFEVAKNAARPFIVKTDDLEVRAIGTRFSVRRTDDGTRVVVTEGRVRVSRTGDASTAPVELGANNQVLVAVKEQIPPPVAIDTAAATSWTSGMIQFEDVPLNAVLQEVNRYTPKSFVISDPALQDIRLTGRFRVGDMDSVKFALANRFDIGMTEDAREIRLSKP
ncbi:FecR family protein [Steroidobacter sp.]|uniref:FecR family protein n=1 Tax=Steroidobacter sp. TaxID=1978227 RepID=UPI001A4CAA0C|nr:FecR family protein [Steroidobacter sp.]MBL8268166.1 FecR family protein [Steroidobacter sp.]